MNECEKYQLLISSLIDSELNDEEKSALAKHLETCHRCRFMYESFSALSQSLSAELEDVPAGLNENIMANIRREDIKKKNSKKLPRPVRALIATAACAVIIVGAAFGLKPLFGSNGSYATENYVLRSGETAPAADNAVMDFSADAAEAVPEEEFDASSVPSLIRFSPEAESPELGSYAGVKSFSGTFPVAEADGKPANASPVSPPELLSPENYDSLMTLLSVSVSDKDPQIIKSSALLLSLSCSDGRAMELYNCENVLYCLDSSSDTVYTAACQYSEISDFLNQIS